MKIGPKLGWLVAGLVAAQAVTVAGSGYILVSEGQKFADLVEKQSEELNTIGALNTDRAGSSPRLWCGGAFSLMGGWSGGQCW